MSKPKTRDVNLADAKQVKDIDIYFKTLRGDDCALHVFFKSIDKVMILSPGYALKNALDSYTLSNIYTFNAKKNEIHIDFKHFQLLQNLLDTERHERREALESWNDTSTPKPREISPNYYADIENIQNYLKTDDIPELFLADNDDENIIRLKIETGKKDVVFKKLEELGLKDQFKFVGGVLNDELLIKSEHFEKWNKSIKEITALDHTAKRFLFEATGSFTTALFENSQISIIYNSTQNEKVSELLSRFHFYKNLDYKKQTDSRNPNTTEIIFSKEQLEKLNNNFKEVYKIEAEKANAIEEFWKNNSLPSIEFSSRSMDNVIILKVGLGDSDIAKTLLNALNLEGNYIFKKIPGLLTNNEIHIKPEHFHEWQHMIAEGKLEKLIKETQPLMNEIMDSLKEDKPTQRLNNFAEDTKKTIDSMLPFSPPVTPDVRQEIEQSNTVSTQEIKEQKKIDPQRIKQERRALPPIPQEHRHEDTAKDDITKFVAQFIDKRESRPQRVAMTLTNRCQLEFSSKEAKDSFLMFLKKADCPEEGVRRIRDKDNKLSLDVNVINWMVSTLEKTQTNDFSSKNSPIKPPGISGPKT